MNNETNRVLLLEDLATDVELIEREVRRVLPQYELKWVETREDFLSALDSFHPDLILSDYSLPGFDGLSALKIAREQAAVTPFILVTGSLNEETAVECMKAGAWDYVIKEHIKRLGPAIISCLEQKQRRKERRLAEEALRESEDRYRIAIEHSNDGVALVEENRLVFVNTQYTRIFGYTRPEELIGQPFYLNVHPDDRKRTIEINRLRQQGEGVPQHYECKGVRKDGSLVYLEISAARTLFRQKAVSLVYLRDITERKLGEAERERLLAAIEQAGETIVLTDPQGTIQYVNPAFETVTGYSRLEALGKTMRLLKSGKQNGAFYRDLWETITGGRIWKGRMINKRKDGELYIEEATISPIFDPSRRIVNYVAVKRDITNHIRLTEQFQQAQKMESIGRLAGGIAHDFNNLLTTILGNAQMALLDSPENGVLHEFINEIIEAGQKASELIRQLLAFSRKQVLHIEVLDLNEVVRDVEKMLKRLIGEDIELKTELGSDPGGVRVDPGQMEQVLFNLAVNARDAMPGGGRLTIETARAEIEQGSSPGPGIMPPGSYVRLRISDTGLGMSAEIQAQIFEPFFTTKEEGKGTGLGLSTVYGIIKQSGGYIWADSETGKGTALTIYLPRIENETARQKETKTKTELPEGSERILVVEDDENLNQMISKILTNCGYTVISALGGPEALEALKRMERPFDLLLTDVVMPGMNGRELADQMKQGQPGLKVLFMSGYTDSSYFDSELSAQEHLYLQKPFILEELVIKVRKTLRG